MSEQYLISVSPNHVIVGDTFSYTLTLTYNVGLGLEQVPVSANFKPFELVHMTVSKQVGKNKKTLKLIYQLQALDPVVTVIPTQSITFSSPTGFQVMAISSQTVSINSAFSQGEKKEMQAFKFLDLKLSYWIILLILMAGILLMGGIWALRTYLKKKKNEAALEPKIVLTAAEKALAALDALKDRIGFLDQEAVRLYYFEFSDIVKHFLTEQYCIEILERTTDESLLLLSRVLESSTLQRVKFLLTQSDLVKFSKWNPDDAFHADMRTRCIEMIHQLEGKR